MNKLHIITAILQRSNELCLTDVEKHKVACGQFTLHKTKTGYNVKFN